MCEGYKMNDQEKIEYIKEELEKADTYVIQQIYEYLIENEG